MIDQNLCTNASISTMWAIKNFPELDDFFRVSKTAGFQKIELNHQVDSSMLSNIHADHVQFSSIHEPCPADISTKELVDRDWLISSDDETLRQRGVDAVKRSIKLANKLGAPVVVVHCGIVSLTIMNLERELRGIFDRGDTQSQEYQDIKIEMIKLREKLVPRRLDAVKKSLRELLDFADPLNIKLGLENRYHFMDIPSIDEMDHLLSLGDADHLGYIYDVGHAQAMGRLGFYRHEDWLTRYSGRMFGCHLHDVVGLIDHYAPGLGEIDYKKIAPYLPRDAFRTMEILPHNTLTQVKRGLEILAEAGCISC